MKPTKKCESGLLTIYTDDDPDQSINTLCYFSFLFFAAHIFQLNLKNKKGDPDPRHCMFNATNYVLSTQRQLRLMKY